ncbi:LPS export ABC transporter permease LptF [Mangrovicoccus sp. HB161399]|uniref:LPS export ABC transporter permease LptF n=1 Tax=Mangrovicoccus sp. HB161399 TaxID=2720392 RepID=UPI0015543679|nr:LPS export ABC transporter permease LptF [Mangrovicoccus sp. HB161399]
MGRFDRYLLSQLMLVFGFFALVLVGVYWINRAVILIDQFMGAGGSGILVLELTLLTLPTLVKLVLPIAAFLAVIQVCNRLYSESELVVVQATGFSGFRLARPVLVFGCIAGLLIGVLAHVLVPVSMSRLNDKEAALADAASSRLLVPGTFQHPVSGVTIYVREIDAEGVIRGLMISDRRDPEQAVTYTAEQALFLRDDTGPKLVMLDGMAQTLDIETERLAITRFSDFTFAVDGLVGAPSERRLDPRQVSTPRLLAASERLQQQTRRDTAWLRREAHMRFAESTLTPALCVMGFSALLLGTFSRFGLWRQIVLAVLLVVVVKVFDNAAADIAKRAPAAWPVIYAPSLLAGAIAVLLLWLGGGRLHALSLALKRRRRAA